MQTFSSQVIKIAKSIPAGRVTAYGAIARAAGGGGQAARSITGILGRAYQNGDKDIPFHRIVYSDGCIFSDPAYDALRMKLYKKEGIKVDKAGKIENFQEILIHF